MPEPCELGTSIRKSSLPSYLILIIPEFRIGPMKDKGPLSVYIL